MPFGADNVYNITVNALDSNDNILGSQSVVVTVVDANDIGVLSEITGVVRQGQQLTAGLVDDEDDPVDNLRYQWTSNGSNILGATNSTYTLQSSDVGRQIRVENNV